MFSGGKDAIAAAHLWRKYYTGPDPVYVYLYFVDGLDYVERTLKHYEKLWNIKIHRRPCEEHLNLEARQQGLKKQCNRMSDIERGLRSEFNRDWIISGIKRADSLARRGMLKTAVDGISKKDRKIYPIIDWSHKQVFAYCTLNKLPLSVFYGLGRKMSIWVPNLDDMLLIRAHFPQDYAKIVAKFPEMEHNVFRLEAKL